MKTEKKKTLRGSVLFTVVCVMALLIIFLTGTLALASAAGNRAHKSYSTSQANYTARAAIDSFTTAMSRDLGLEAAVESLSSGGQTSMHPKVVINDKTLGEVGYFNGNTWVPDRIEVAAVPGSESYAYFKKNDSEPPSWNKTDLVRVTATCKVGREFETVTAYIRKTPASRAPNNPGGINGLQEAGGNHFPNGAVITGGLGVGISNDDQSETFHTHNKSNVETTLTYVNGSLSSATSGYKFWVKKPQDDSKATKPYSQTVIDGNLSFTNNSGFYLDYEMPGAYTQKDVPYLFVNQALCGPTSSGVEVVNVDARVKNAVPPFNIFAGTMKFNGPITMYADLYLMDTKDGSSYDVIGYDNQGRNASYDMTVQKGVNYFGGQNGSGNKLYAWTRSVVQKQDTQFNSAGGSIYCKGDLNLRQATIYGDVRVEGNCTVQDGVTIYGNLVVGGNLDLQSVPSIIGGSIYSSISSGNGTRQIKDGYSWHENEIRPGIIEVPNVMYENTEVPNVEERSSVKMDHDPWHNEIRYPDGTVEDLEWATKTIYIMPNGTDYYEFKPYYRTDENGFDDTSTIVEGQYSKYKADPTGKATSESTDKDSTFYREPENIGGEYVEVAERDARGSFYLKDATNEVVPESEAVRNATSSDLYKPVSDYFQKTGQTSIYPTNMEREVIWGKKENGIFTVTDQPEKKLIKNLDEVREDLHYDAEHGKFDTETYPHELPANLPYAFNNGQKTAVWEDGYITTSCILADETNPNSYTIDETIKIKPVNTDIWIGLNNVTFNQHKEIVCYPGGGTVKFMIDGELYMENCSIRSSELTKNMTVRYDDVWGIEYYGTEDSEIRMVNNCTLVGTMKAPTTLLSGKVAGYIPVKYLDEYGTIWPKPGDEELKPVIIGSALVEKVTEAQNDFSVINSGGGGNQNNNQTIRGQRNWYELTYYMGV